MNENTTTDMSNNSSINSNGVKHLYINSEICQNLRIK
jgi:hypothetical protein